ncbi:penicillin-binding transpeptidase domain-containing protein [Brotonthovivens ammoniilytica]|uniref:Penicillin-binding transpeptidase domain-containing protein n=1 Tax=Brotonthovivens ammoniilytica TaxID=2981725 RepID=A0ABT2TI14_9FIRM|nr:penicillin-binding transpeptidase domain-containing protein [Brotonthovivens ammoniilytica]MCU6761297.1 penicillin-binding transpeptidase domain-containing protein [Brotonthovivens ammoniilytica]
MIDMNLTGGREENQGSIRKKSTKSGRNQEFAIITYLFLAIFLILIGYFIYFQVFKSEDVISSPYNSRANLYAEHVIRGDILSSDGKVLAETVTNSKGEQTRSYPYENMFAHVVGYVNNGKSGLESQMNFKLLRSHSFFLVQLMNELRDEKNQGDSVVSTLDYRVQKAAYDALGNQDGAVVVLEPKTGKILAMVSKPDFNPNTLAKNWDSIVADEDSSILLNRATQGLYPPGSTFKIVTVLEYIRENGVNNKFHFDCDGSVEVNGEVIHCYNNSVHGEEDLKKAFAKSCNSAFSTIGLDLNLKKYAELCSDMLFNQDLPVSFEANNSRFSLGTDASTGKIMQTAIGQGDTLVTPLHMAMIAAAIDNDGTVMKPYLVDHIENDGGVNIKSYKPSEAGAMISKEEAGILQELMEEVVNSGTASKLSGQSYSAAGKTGSAEFGTVKGHSHAWFVGYGSKDSYNDIAIAVIVEDGGSGSGTAVPIAKKVFDKYFNTKS